MKRKSAHVLGLIVCGTLLTVACGGGSSSSTGTTTTNSGPGSPPGQTAAVSVSAGQTSTGVNVTVPAPAASPALNAQFLGVGGNTAFSTGSQIHLGQSATVFLFGPGLSGVTQVKISGPADITVTGIHGITATDNTPGIAFTASVSGSATPGGRTVLLMNSQNDITTFTGGLEVVP